MKKMTAEHFAQELSKTHPNVQFTKSLEETKQNLKALTEGYEIVLVMGAGDVYKILR